MNTTYNCDTCGTELKRHEAHLRGNAIDAEPTAWCRIHAIAAGIFTPPMPPIAPAVPVQIKRTSLVRRLVGQR